MLMKIQLEGNSSVTWFFMKNHKRLTLACIVLASSIPLCTWLLLMGADNLWANVSRMPDVRIFVTTCIVALCVSFAWSKKIIKTFANFNVAS